MLEDVSELNRFNHLINNYDRIAVLVYNEQKAKLRNGINMNAFKMYQNIGNEMTTDNPLKMITIPVKLLDDIVSYTPTVLIYLHGKEYKKIDIKSQQDFIYAKNEIIGINKNKSLTPQKRKNCNDVIECTPAKKIKIIDSIDDDTKIDELLMSIPNVNIHNDLDKKEEELLDNLVNELHDKITGNEYKYIKKDSVSVDDIAQYRVNLETKFNELAAEGGNDETKDGNNIKGDNSLVNSDSEGAFYKFLDKKDSVHVIQNDYIDLNDILDDIIVLSGNGYNDGNINYIITIYMIFMFLFVFIMYYMDIYNHQIWLNIFIIVFLFYGFGLIIYNDYKKTMYIDNESLKWYYFILNVLQSNKNRKLIIKDMYLFLFKNGNINDKIWYKIHELIMNNNNITFCCTIINDIQTDCWLFVE